MYLAPELAAPQEAPPPDAGAVVRFTGPVSGCLTIAVHAGLGRAIAAQMLGGDDPGAEQQQDALGEIANVICGNMLPSLGNGSGHFKIGQPRPLAPGSPAQAALGRPAVTAVINLEAGRADLALHLGDAAPGEGAP
jgi:CheY-specific phosphatase CheX